MLYQYYLKLSPQHTKGFQDSCVAVNLFLLKVDNVVECMAFAIKILYN